MTDYLPSRQMREFVSWRLATEMYRRYPDQLSLVEMHPGGGQYDCLSLLSNDDDLTIHINREGSVAVWSKAANLDSERPWGQKWSQHLIGSEDLKEDLDELSNLIRWQIPNPLPPSTPGVITFRFITEFLTHVPLSRRQWEWRNGFHDTAGYSGGVMADWFAAFPQALESAREQGPRGFMSNSEYKFWFLVKNMADKSPSVCLETNGNAYTKDGRTLNLFEIYEKERRIWPLIFKTIPELLP